MGAEVLAGAGTGERDLDRQDRVGVEVDPAGIGDDLFPLLQIPFAGGTGFAAGTAGLGASGRGGGAGLLTVFAASGAAFAAFFGAADFAAVVRSTSLRSRSNLISCDFRSFSTSSSR